MLLPLSIAVFLTALLPAGSDSIQTSYEQLRGRWSLQVEQVASELDRQGDSDAAERIRKSLQTQPSDGLISMKRIVAASPSEESIRPGPGNDILSAWKRQQKQYAKELFDLANAAFRAGQVSRCYDLLREVIEHDPDHGRARAILGFTKYRSDWVTPFAAGKLKAGHIWHAQFGWIPKNHVPRYESGEQLWKGQWLPADEVARYRMNWANAWEVESDHYVVRTNVSLERGVELVTRLEQLYSIFFRLYAGFFSPRDQVAVLLDPSNRRVKSEGRQAKKFRVHYYRSREEYLEALRPYVKSGLDVTTGMYLTGTRVAYFYQTNQPDDSTVVHEATHQLFSEARDHRHGDGSRGNFWVLEGIACYMESLEEKGDRIELGSWSTQRLHRARQRRGKFKATEELAALGREDFNKDDVVNLYAQSACLAHFLMHYDGGRYRDALVKYLEEVYLGRADYATLPELLGVDWTTLDEQFRRHVSDSEEPAR